MLIENTYNKGLEKHFYKTVLYRRNTLKQNLINTSCIKAKRGKPMSFLKNGLQKIQKRNFIDNEQKQQLKAFEKREF